MGRSGHQKKKSNAWLIIFGLIALAYWYITVPVVLLVAYIWKRKAIHRFLLRDTIQRMEELTYLVRSGLKTHQEILDREGASARLFQLRDRIVGEMGELQQIFQKTKKYLEPENQQEVLDVLHLSYQLDLVEDAEVVEPQAAEQTVFSRQEQIARLAPEILETYCNVQRDHLVVCEKLQANLDKKEELTALHEANMQRFEDILEGYLKMKASPKDFFNATERLQQAKEAMEQFDSQLDETIRQFNEEDMRDFEISLRMMRKEEE